MKDHVCIIGKPGKQQDLLAVDRDGRDVLEIELGAFQRDVGRIDGLRRDVARTRIPPGEGGCAAAGDGGQLGNHQTLAVFDVLGERRCALVGVERVLHILPVLIQGEEAVCAMIALRCQDIDGKAVGSKGDAVVLYREALRNQFGL